MISGVKLGDLSFSVSSSGIVLTRKGYPWHLTFCNNKKLNALDIHIKNQNTGEIYPDRIIIPLAEIEKYSKHFNDFLNQFLLSLKPVRPSWLYHHGYGIIFIEESETADLFLDNNIVKKGKLVFNWGNTLETFKEKKGLLYTPHCLYDLMDENFRGIVYAQGVRKNNKFKRLILFCVNLGLERQWHGITEGKMISIISSFRSNEFADKLKVIFDKIIEKFDLKKMQIKGYFKNGIQKI